MLFYLDFLMIIVLKEKKLYKLAKLLVENGAKNASYLVEKQNQCLYIKEKILLISVKCNISESPLNAHGMCTEIWILDIIL